MTSVKITEFCYIRVKPKQIYLHLHIAVEIPEILSSLAGYLLTNNLFQELRTKCNTDLTDKNYNFRNCA